MGLPSGGISPHSIYVLGADLARMGKDSSVFIIIEKMPHNDSLYVVHIEELKHKLLTEAIGRIKYLESKFKFNKILVDATGMGAAVVDVLKEELNYKVEDIIFTVKSKQNLYNNLKFLMEKGLLKIPFNKKLYYQLVELEITYTTSGDMKIHHPPNGHDDFSDALALAAFYFKQNEEYIPVLA